MQFEAKRYNMSKAREKTGNMTWESLGTGQFGPSSPLGNGCDCPKTSNLRYVVVEKRLL